MSPGDSWILECFNFRPRATFPPKPRPSRIWNEPPEFGVVLGVWAGRDSQSTKCTVTYDGETALNCSYRSSVRRSLVAVVLCGLLARRTVRRLKRGHTATNSSRRSLCRHLRDRWFVGWLWQVVCGTVECRSHFHLAVGSRGRLPRRNIASPHLVLTLTLA